MIRFGPQNCHFTSTATLWLVMLACALSSRALMAAVNDHHPSDAWVPSQEWSPRVAELPTHLRMVRAARPDSDASNPTAEASAVPRVDNEGCTPNVICDGDGPHPSFMPSLGRFGLLAPAAAGNDVPSACAGENGALFGPPPCAGPHESTLPPCVDQ